MEGITVVVDRYYYSGIVYSAAKGNPSLGLEWARSPEVGLPLPDLCIFLDITPEAAAERGGFGNEKYETNDMQRTVRSLFHRLMELPDGEQIRVLNAGRSISEVELDISRLVDGLKTSPQMRTPLGSITCWD